MLVIALVILGTSSCVRAPIYMTDPVEPNPLHQAFVGLGVDGQCPHQITASGRNPTDYVERFLRPQQHLRYSTTGLQQDIDLDTDCVAARFSNDALRSWAGRGDAVARYVLAVRVTEPCQNAAIRIHTVASVAEHRLDVSDRPDQMESFLIPEAGFLEGLLL